MEYDPKFPDRPLTPFFDELSKALIQNDDAADSSSYEKISNDLGIDMKSLLYAAKQRTGRVLHQRGNSDIERLLIAAWMDAFCAARRMDVNRLPEEGQHRG